jgi:hypothetical protein
VASLSEPGVREGNREGGGTVIHPIFRRAGIALAAEAGTLTVRRNPDVPFRC